MLIGIFAVVAAIVSLATCFGTAAFESLRWIWVLPVSFLGGFLGVVILWCVLLVVMAKLVDLDKKYETDAPFYRWVADKTIRAAITILGVKIHTQGLEKAPKDGRFLLVCNHLDNVDPALLLWALPGRKLSFISKRENDKLFILGPFLRRIGCQPINRENDREALTTILTCIDIIKNDRLSIGVFPEGYIRDDRLLRPFRHGVFKIAKRTGVPIVVCTLQNTHHVLPNALKLKRTEVELHLVDVISSEEVAQKNTVQLGEQIYNMMAQDLGPELVYHQEPENV